MILIITEEIILMYNYIHYLLKLTLCVFTGTLKVHGVFTCIVKVHVINKAASLIVLLTVTFPLRIKRTFKATCPFNILHVLPFVNHYKML